MRRGALVSTVGVAAAWTAVAGCATESFNRCTDGDATREECEAACKAEDPPPAWCEEFLDGGTGDAEPPDGDTDDGDTPDAGPCGACDADEVCDTDAEPPACVGCLGDMDCDADATPVCDTETNTCVQCTENADCTEPTASLCDTTENECVPCTISEECSHLEGLGVCDTSSAPAECVECTMTEAGACEERPCTMQRTCSEYGAGAQEPCEPCDTDDNCAGANDYCVPMMFEGTDHGSFCLTDADDVGGCTRPFSVPLEGRTSVSGREGGRYCGINEDVASCEAVRALLEDWRCSGTNGQCSPADGEPEVDVPGALCRMVGVLANRCTYECSGAAQCDESPNPGSTCGPGTTDGVDYCGG